MKVLVMAKHTLRSDVPVIGHATAPPKLWKPGHLQCQQVLDYDGQRKEAPGYYSRSTGTRTAYM